MVSPKGRHEVRAWYDRTWPQISVATVVTALALVSTDAVLSASAAAGVFATGTLGRFAAGSHVPFVPHRLPRLRAPERPVPPADPNSHAATVNAVHAALDELRAAITTDVTELGELLALVPVSGDAPDRTDAEHLRALDSYAAAGRILDDADADLLDLAGALVLAGDARESLVLVLARHTGRPAPARSRPCFFNPLHGRSARTVRWRTGRNAALNVPVCPQCRRTVQRGGTPDALVDVTAAGHVVPYYAAPPERSVWAATGFGTVRRDLAARVQRGEHRLRHQGGGAPRRKRRGDTQ